MAQTKISMEQFRSELEAGKSVRQIGREYGVHDRTLRRKLEKLKDTGFDLANHRNYHNPENQIVSGYSTLVRHKDKEDGTTGRVMEWVKTNRKIADQLDQASTVIAAMSSELPQIKNIPQTKKTYYKDKFTVLPIGDPHIGLLTWSKEVGEDWDVKIAQRVFKKVFQRLLARLPDTEEAILVNTGDFFHADNIFAESSRSGHKFDVDGRHGKWLDAGVVICRMLIESCLAKYKKVEFINVPGNHDDILGRALGTFTKHMYEKQKRLTVQVGDAPFQYVRRGKVLLGFAHGHTCKLPSLPGKMADDQAILWGQTTFRHWITGHVHHNSWLQYKEHPGCSVETVGIIPPKDAYAFGGGYGAGRGTQAIVFDSVNGDECERYREKVRSDD